MLPNNPSYKLAISIVLYQQSIQIVDRLITMLSSTNCRILLYLIDNSPKPIVQEKLLDYSSLLDIKYIFTNKNLGYGKAHNIGIMSNSESISYYLIMNPDISFEPSSIEKIIQYMDENENISLLMPQIRYPNGDMQYLCKKIPAPLDLIGRRFFVGPLKYIIQKRLDNYELRHLDYNKSMEIPNLSGCFMFCRNDSLKSIGGFDNRFFMYLEDVDLCRRIRKTGKTFYFAEAIVYHDYAKDSYKKLKLLFYHVISSIKYFNKWGWIFDKERNEINNSFKM